MYPWSSILHEKRAFRDLCGKVFWACLLGSICGFAAAFLWTEGGMEQVVLLALSFVTALMTAALIPHVFQRPIMSQASSEVVETIRKQAENLEDYGDKKVSESLHFLIEYCGGVRTYQAEFLLEECRRKKREYERYKLRSGRRHHDTGSA
jgi:hypothetical protein